VSFLLYAPLAYALIRYDTAFTPHAVLGVFIVTLLADLPDEDLDWQQFKIPVTNRNAFFLYGFLQAVIGTLASISPARTRPNIQWRPIVTHRGFTHTIWFISLIGALGTAISYATLYGMTELYGSSEQFDTVLLTSLAIIGGAHLASVLLTRIGVQVSITDTAFIKVIGSIATVTVITQFGVQTGFFAEFSALTIAVLYGGIAGYTITTHIAGDMLTPSGVVFFGSLPPTLAKRMPFTERRFTVNLCRADSSFWNAAFKNIGTIALPLGFLFAHPVTRDWIATGLIFAAETL